MTTDRHEAPQPNLATTENDRVHFPKMDPEVSQAAWAGHKTAEIRINDRAFRVGDQVSLRETQLPHAEMEVGAEPRFTGRSMFFPIDRQELGRPVQLPQPAQPYFCHVAVLLDLANRVTPAHPIIRLKD